MTLGQAVRVLRKNRNLNQQELALKVGISSVSISQIELDKKWPSRSTIESICQVLDYTMEDLFRVASTKL